MSEPRDETAEAGSDGGDPSLASTPAAEREPPAAAPPPRVRRAAVAWLGGAVAAMVVAIAIVLTAPFWVLPVLGLLPWHGGAAKGQAVLSGRIDALERRLGTPGPDAAPIKASVTALAARIDALDAKIAGLPAIDPAQLAKLRKENAELATLVAALGQRL